MVVVVLSVTRMAAVIIIVVRINSRISVPVVVIVIAAPIVGVSIVAMVIDVQTVCEPSDSERGRDAPEESAIERVAVGIGIVVDRVRAGVIIVGRSRLVDDNLLWFIVGNVEDIFINRTDLNDTLIFGDGLARVASQIAGCVGTITKRFHSCDNIGLLHNHCFAKPPCLVKLVAK